MHQRSNSTILNRPRLSPCDAALKVRCEEVSKRTKKTSPQLRGLSKRAKPAYKNKQLPKLSFQIQKAATGWLPTDSEAIN